jgi:hypothetical protein
LKGDIEIMAGNRRLINRPFLKAILAVPIVVNALMGCIEDGGEESRLSKDASLIDNDNRFDSSKKGGAGMRENESVAGQTAKGENGGSGGSGEKDRSEGDSAKGGSPGKSGSGGTIAEVGGNVSLTVPIRDSAACNAAIQTSNEVTEETRCLCAKCLEPYGNCLSDSACVKLIKCASQTGCTSSTCGTDPNCGPIIQSMWGSEGLKSLMQATSVEECRDKNCVSDSGM